MCVLCYGSLLQLSLEEATDLVIEQLASLDSKMPTLPNLNIVESVQ